MTTTVFTENLANYLLDNFDVTKANENNIWIGGRIQSRKQFCESNMKMKLLQEASVLDVLDWTDMERVKFYKGVFDCVGTFLKDEALGRFKEGNLPESELDRGNFIPLLDVRTDQLLMFNTPANQISEMTYKAWERKLTKDERVFITDKMRDALLVYDPYELASLVPIDFEGMEVLKVNTYKPPAWRMEQPPEFVECPEVIWKVLKHIFPDKKCLDFVLNWMHLALTKRNETYLVLNGKKGIGKGVFCSMLSALVGMENYSESPSSLLTKDFNSVLDKKRMIVMDEEKVGKTEHTKLKRFINKYQNIEKKGIDADHAVEIFNNYVISNNELSDMYIEPDDRRFSVPDLTIKNIFEILTQDQLDQLHDDLENDAELVWEFGYFIFEYGKSKFLNQFSTWKGVRFWELAYNSLYEWKKFIVDKVLSCDEVEYEIGRMRKEFVADNPNFARFPKNPKRIEDFLINYLHRGEIVLGEVVKEEGKWYVVPDDRYMPDEGSTNDGDDDIL